jgi:ubiquinone/menaquinone biosynthesis C-methylase UbiE
MNSRWEKNLDFRDRGRRSGPAAAGALAGVRARYRREAQRYDRRWARYLQGTIEPTLAALGERPAGRVLDVGCGSGLLLDRLTREGSGGIAVGLDASPEMLARASGRLGRRAALCAGDVHELPFRDAAFDTVVSSSSLHHWADAARALAEIARVTRSGGRLVLTDWSDDYLALRLLSRVLRLYDRSHRRSYRADEARCLLEAEGFRVEGIHRFRVGWLWGMMTVEATRR